jgi:transposase
MRQRLVDLGRELQSITLVYDRGNVSRANQQLVDESQISYVASLTATSRHALIEVANRNLEPVLVGDERVMTFRTRQMVWGAERTLVVLVSERLREGQFRGVLQHLESAQRWLGKLSATLERGKQRRPREHIERDIAVRLGGRQHLRKVLQVELLGTKKLTLQYSVDQTALQQLREQWLGRLVLMTNRHDWSTSEIIQAYRGQSDVEAVFAHLKDPTHLALHPQYHWTDQKLHVHVLICLLGYLLARLLHRKAQQDAGYTASLERLLEDLSRIRQVKVARPTGTKGRLRLATQLEKPQPDLQSLAAALKLDV